MGQKPIGRASDFHQRVVDEIERRMAEVQMTRAQLISKSGVPQNSFYTKMRGEKPFNLNEIEKLAKAMDADAMLLLRDAAGTSVGAVTETAIPSSDREVADIATKRNVRRSASQPDKIAAQDQPEE